MSRTALLEKIKNCSQVLSNKIMCSSFKMILCTTEGPVVLPTLPTDETLSNEAIERKKGMKGR